MWRSSMASVLAAAWGCQVGPHKEPYAGLSTQGAPRWFQLCGLADSGVSLPSAVTLGATTSPALPCPDMHLLPGLWRNLLPRCLPRPLASRSAWEGA